MEADTDYKINVFSLIEHGGELVRSDPLQARVCNGNRVYRLKSKVQLAAKRKTVSMSDLTMQVAEKHLWKSSVGLEKADFITEQRFWEKENSDKLEDQRCDGDPC